jgi:hypothetical protein
VFLSLWESSRCPEPGKMRAVGSLGMEDDPRFAPAFDANMGFVVNPYQTGNPDKDTAVMIGSSVSYILSEVKYFTLFIVVLTVLALNAYALIVYFVLDKIAKPGTAALVKRTSGLMSLEIDEMLAEIDSVMEKSKLIQRGLLK